MSNLSIISNNSLSMTSREIAELVDSRHQDRIQSGLLEHKASIIIDAEGRERVRDHFGDGVLHA